MYTLPNYSKYLMFGQNVNVSYRVTSNIYGNEIRAKYLCRVIKKKVSCYTNIDVFSWTIYKEGITYNSKTSISA